MGSLRVFEDVAAARISPEDAAALLIAEDRRKLAIARPSWAPAWLWNAAMVSAAAFLSAVGLRR